MSWWDRRGVHNPAFTILSMVVLVIGSWDQQGQNARHEFLAQIGHGISVRTTSINRTLALELDLQASSIRIILLKAIKWAWIFLQFLIDLAKDTMVSFMITLPCFGEEESFAALNTNIMLRVTSWQLADLFLDHLVPNVESERLKKSSSHEWQWIRMAIL